MNIIVNGVASEVRSATLRTVLDELGYANASVATALNGEFVPASEWLETKLDEGDRLEVMAPMSGG